jgi:hypothetical protein
MSAMRNPPQEKGRDQIAGLLEHYAQKPYADASNETVRVRALLLSTAAAHIKQLEAFVELYWTTYAGTQTHPTVIQEAAVINAARALREGKP